MFDWLERELAEIKTPRFHIVDGPADVGLEEAVTRSGLSVPVSYRQFVLEFGNAGLYRNSRDGYTICIFASPREAVLKDGTRVHCLGFNDAASIYVKAMPNMVSIPVFEFDGGEETMVGDFADWLFRSCNLARERHGKKWAEILLGPEPFTPEEQAMIETRRKIKWRVLGIDEKGNHIFEVTNNGSQPLPFLTVGLRSSDRQLKGAVRLDTHGICPGQTGIIHADCYKKFKPPQEMEAFALPDPRPEEREYYYEFRKVLK